MKYLVFIFILMSSMEAKKPNLELGVGIAGVSYPSYLGSNREKFFPIIYPYITYHSKILDLDNSGIKKELFDIDGLGLELSASGSFPVDSDSSPLRKGMDDLDLMFEIGGMGSYRLWEKSPYTLLFRLPLRAVLSTNLSSRLDYRGLLANPEIKLSHKKGERIFSFMSGALFSSSRYHDYFYGVDKKFVTKDREAYRGESGYGGWRSKIGFADRSASWVYDAYIIHYFLEGAVFESSPLVEKKHGFFLQVSLSYIFYTH